MLASSKLIAVHRHSVAILAFLHLIPLAYHILALRFHVDHNYLGHSLHSSISI